MTVGRWIAIGESTALVDGGDGLRFGYRVPGARDASADAPASTLPAFAVRHRGAVRAFLNQCAHVPVELDWLPGRFFDAEGLYLICATHGATYRPADGGCIAGPCRGRSLVALPCDEADGMVRVFMGHGAGN